MIRINLCKSGAIIENVAAGPPEDWNLIDCRKAATAIPMKSRDKIRTEYDLESLTLDTTSNINPFCKEEIVYVTIDISKRDYIWTGWISPLWFLTHKRTICCIQKKGTLLVQFELVFNSYSIEQYMDNPTLVASNLGNCIRCCVEKSIIEMEILYARKPKFEEYCIAESRQLQNILIPLPKPKSEPKPKPEPKPPKQTESEIPQHCCTDIDIDYWDTLFNLPSEEQAYYGWEHDPQ